MILISILAGIGTIVGWLWSILSALAWAFVVFFMAYTTWENLPWIAGGIGVIAIIRGLSQIRDRIRYIAAALAERENHT